MPRKSSIERLPLEIRSRLDEEIRKGVLTVDELTQWLDDRGAPVSRSAVGRYRQRAAATIEHYKHAQEAANQILGGIGEQAESKTGLLVGELMKTMMFRYLIAQQGEEDESGEFEARNLALLSRSLKDISTSQKTDQQYRQQVRAEIEAEQAARLGEAEKEMAEVAKSEGLTPAAAARMRAILMGTAPSE